MKTTDGHQRQPTPRFFGCSSERTRSKQHAAHVALTSAVSFRSLHHFLSCQPFTATLTSLYPTSIMLRQLVSRNVAAPAKVSRDWHWLRHTLLSPCLSSRHNVQSLTTGWFDHLLHSPAIRLSSLPHSLASFRRLAEVLPPELRRTMSSSLVVDQVVTLPLSRLHSKVSR